MTLVTQGLISVLDGSAWQLPARLLSTRESTLPPARTDLRLGGHRANLATVEERKFYCAHIYSVTSVQNWGITTSFSYF
jgi:hypothetical protein